MQPGYSILILGSGIAGMLHIHLAQSIGAGNIIATDIVDYRLEQAKRFGANFTIHAKEKVPTRIREVNNGRLADVVVICTTDTTAISQTLDSVERGGTVLFFAPTNKGISIPQTVNDIFWRKEITLTSSYAGNRADHVAALELIRRRRIQVKEMITHRLPLAQIQLGFQLVANAQESMKVVIEPQK
jgi:L-iditol 2-dehydrogenase